MELVECEVFGVQQTHPEVDLGIGAEPQPRRDVLRLVSCGDIGRLQAHDCPLTGYSLVDSISVTSPSTMDMECVEVEDVVSPGLRLCRWMKLGHPCSLLRYDWLFIPSYSRRSQIKWSSS